MLSCFWFFFAEVWLCLGSLGISSSKTEAVRKGLPAHRPRMSVSYVQEVSQEQTKPKFFCEPRGVGSHDNAHCFQSIFAPREQLLKYLKCTRRPRWTCLLKRQLLHFGVKEGCVGDTILP